MSRVIVCGSRTWTRPELVEWVLRALPPGSVVMHGNAKGADLMADQIAHRLGLAVERFHADWKRYGRKAGMIRNRTMLDQLPDWVVAFWDGKSRGTEFMITEAHNQGLPVVVIPPDCLLRA